MGEAGPPHPSGPAAISRPPLTEDNWPPEKVQGAIDVLQTRGGTDAVEGVPETFEERRRRGPQGLQIDVRRRRVNTLRIELEQPIPSAGDGAGDLHVGRRAGERHIGTQIVSVGMQGDFGEAAVVQHELAECSRGPGDFDAAGLRCEGDRSAQRTADAELLRQWRHRPGGQWIGADRRAFQRTFRFQLETRDLLELKRTSGPVETPSKECCRNVTSDGESTVACRLFSSVRQGSRLNANGVKPNCRMVGQRLDARIGFDSTRNSGLQERYGGLIELERLIGNRNCAGEWIERETHRTQAGGRCGKSKCSLKAIGLQESGDLRAQFRQARFGSGGREAEIADHGPRRDRVAGGAGLASHIKVRGFERDLAAAGASADLLRGGVRGQLPLVGDIGTDRQLIGPESGGLDLLQLDLAVNAPDSR